MREGRNIKGEILEPRDKGSRGRSSKKKIVLEGRRREGEGGNTKGNWFHKVWEEARTKGVGVGAFWG